MIMTTDQKEGMSELGSWLAQWRLSQYEDKLKQHGIEFKEDFKYIKSAHDFEELIAKLGDVPFMHSKKFKDAWSTIVPVDERTSDVQIHFLGDDERQVMDKLYQRYSEISTDINTVQKANNDFNSSVVASKKTVNDYMDELVCTINTKRQQLLEKIDLIHDQNKKLFVQKLDTLDQMNKLCSYNKEKFEIIASSKGMSSAERLKKLQQLLSMNVDHLNEDEKKAENDNYDNYKIIGDQCVVAGAVTVNIDKDANSLVDSFVAIVCDQVKTDWKMKRNYAGPDSADWSKAEQLNLRGGTGGKSAEKKYVVDNIIVEASHPVHNSGTNYYIEYMFDGNTTTDNSATHMWLTSAVKDQTLTFTFPSSIQLSHIMAYSCAI
eukprot:1143274_1